MNTTAKTQSDTTRLFQLTLEEAPAFGSGAMPAQEDRRFAMLAQLFPLIIWPWKRKVSPAVDAHGKEALNFAITAMIILWPAGIIGSLLGVGMARIISLGTSLLSLAMLALVVFAAAQGGKGKLFRYPVNFRLIK